MGFSIVKILLFVFKNDGSQIKQQFAWEPVFRRLMMWMQGGPPPSACSQCPAALRQEMGLSAAPPRRRGRKGTGRCRPRHCTLRVAASSGLPRSKKPPRAADTPASRRAAPDIPGKKQDCHGQVCVFGISAEEPAGDFLIALAAQGADGGKRSRHADWIDRCVTAPFSVKVRLDSLFKNFSMGSLLCEELTRRRLKRESNPRTTAVNRLLLPLGYSIVAAGAFLLRVNASSGRESNLRISSLLFYRLNYRRRILQDASFSA